MAGASERETQGFEIHTGVHSGAELEALRDLVDRVARESGKANVRHLRCRAPELDRIAFEPAMDHVPEGLGPVRSLLLNKLAEGNGPVAWHQDVTVALADEGEVAGYGPWSSKDGVAHARAPLALLERMWTLRLHLDDTPAENGALRVLPGSHRRGFVDDPTTLLERQDPVTCTCRAGDVLVLSPLLLHASARSVTEGPRRVIHLELAPRAGLDPRLRWYEPPFPWDAPPPPSGEPDGARK